ncbi:hypothetical protein I3842_07G076400 [Carya illinoinensis]|uniref:Uncharacterized protein n=1 Tax=Carya illinoinensis TaxID=32201 RepID=A0A922EIJ2_CARIL|nr:hypothetical protein I3842_07G076400 [Carya illinoinensis]
MKEFRALFPSLSHKILDFCLQEISSISINLLISADTLVFNSFSSLEIVPLNSFSSKLYNCSSRRNLLFLTLPKNSTFHFFKSLLSSFNFPAKIKLGVPRK